jgi:hypothetical protein
LFAGAKVSEIFIYALLGPICGIIIVVFILAFKGTVEELSKE